MQKVQPRLTWALLFTALLLLVFFTTTLFSSPLDFMYRSAAGLSTARSAALIIAVLAAVGIFITAFIIAIPTALQSARWYRKILYVLPVYLLLLTLAGIIFGLLGIGSLGNLLNIQGLGTVSFAVAAPMVGAVLAIIAVVIAAARTRLSEKLLKIAMTTASVSTVLSVVASAAMLISVVIVATSQPSNFGFGDRPGGGFPNDRPSGTNQNGSIQLPAGFSAPQQSGSASSTPTGQNSQSGSIQPPAGFAPPQQSGNTPSTQSVQNNQRDQRGDGRPGGDFNRGGFGGTANVANRYEIGGVVMAILTAVSLIGTVSGGLLVLRAKGGETALQTVSAPLLNYRREIGIAALSCIGVTLVLLGIGQLLVPVSHENPPVQTTLNWDSPQTQNLATRACMDCHSNETAWPWYSYIAPASWLTAMHVTEGRQQFNLSELNNIPAFRLSDLAGEMAQQIRNGTMPPADYLILHPEAQLSDTEKQELTDGLRKTLAQF
jgi:Haem-binding domain